MYKPFKSLRPPEIYMKQIKASRNLHETNLIHDVYEHTQDNFPSSEEEEFQECQEFNTDQDL